MSLKKLYNIITLKLLSYVLKRFCNFYILADNRAVLRDLEAMAKLVDIIGDEV